MIELAAYTMRMVCGRIAAVGNENYCGNLLWQSSLILLNPNKLSRRKRCGKAASALQQGRGYPCHIELAFLGFHRLHHRPNDRAEHLTVRTRPPNESVLSIRQQTPEPRCESLLRHGLQIRHRARAGISSTFSVKQNSDTTLNK